MATRNLFVAFLLLFSFPALSEAVKPLLLGEGTPMPGAVPKMRKANCGKVDLSAKMGPVRNQLGQSCYAYTATDLLNFNRKPPFSALHLAQTADSENETGLRSNQMQINGINQGILSDAVQHGLDHGLCPEKAIPSIDREKSINDFYGLVLEYYQQAEYLGCKQLELSKLEHIYGLSTDLQHKLSVWLELKYAIEQTYPAFNIERLEEIFKHAPREQFFSQVATEACRGKLVKVRGKVKDKNILLQDTAGKWYFEPNRRRELLDHVNRTLARGRPVGISYEGSGLIQPPGRDHGTHMSSVVGRVWKDEVKDGNGNVTLPAGCYYVVKNSWSEDWKVPQGLKASPVSGLPGYFMLSEQSFLEHVHGTTSIE